MGLLPLRVQGAPEPAGVYPRRPGLPAAAPLLRRGRPLRRYTPDAGRNPPRRSGTRKRRMAPPPRRNPHLAAPLRDRGAPGTPDPECDYHELRRHGVGALLPGTPPALWQPGERGAARPFPTSPP